MTPDFEPVAPDEFLIRCVWHDYYDPAVPVPVLARAFLPRKDETDGISVFRLACVSTAEDVLAVFAADKRDGYALALLPFAVLIGMGLTVTPASISTVAGHAVIQEMNVDRCKADKKWCDGIRQQLAVLASMNVIRLPN